HYAGMTPAEIKAKYFTTADNTHSSFAGAELNAQSVIEGLRALTDCPLKNYLLDAQKFPREWIDPDTGHRVIQLSTEPGSESLYFNLNPFTPDGKEMVFTTPDGISMVNLQTRAIENIIRGHFRIIMVGRKTGKIYYIKMNRENHTGTVFTIDPKTKVTRKIVTLPRGEQVSAVNADETLLAGTIDERTDWPTNDSGNPKKMSVAERRHNKGVMMEERFNRHDPMELFFYNIQTGETKKFDRCNDWLNHLQFSPTDPHLLMFCHEGPWHKVNRIWTIRTDGSDLKLIHKRTMDMEIAGHEFWGADGKMIWYDLQTPRGEDFWVGGYNVLTGKRTWYHLQRDEWSVHYNVSPDGKLFCGDGGDDKMVAHAENGKWLYLFHPELTQERGAPEIDQKNLIQTGVFHAERLVNMAKHNYALEPNAMFSPDMKWLIFRSNMSGASQVYEVELKKAARNDGQN
ncbi:MAG: oligogalacturonate lyase family protein, partial [Limisphaerales bacterium]